MPIPPIPPYAGSLFADCTPGKELVLPAEIAVQDILGALANATPEELAALGAVLSGTITPSSSGVAQAIADATEIDRCTIANSVADYMVECGSVGTTVAEIAEEETTKLTVKPGPPGVMTLALELAKDVIDVFGAEQTIAVPECGGTEQALRVINFPSLLTPTGVSMHAVYQQIINMLSQLLVCCNPCAAQADNTQRHMAGSDTITFSLPVNHAKFHFLFVPDPKMVEFGTPDVKYWGKIRFGNPQGQFGKLQFLNSEHCIMYPDIGNADRIAYVMEYDAQGYFTVELQERWTGLQSP